MGLSKGVIDLLNHLLKFDYYQILLTNERQQISYAARKDNPSQKVVINQIKKEALNQPFEVSSLIRSLKHLVMLEEDTQNWYFITEQLAGLPINQEPESFAQMSGELTEETLNAHRQSYFENHLSQLVGLYKHYLVLGAYYTAHLLTPENLRFEAEGLDSVELVVMSPNTEGQTYDGMVCQNFLNSVKLLITSLHINTAGALINALGEQTQIQSLLQSTEQWLNNKEVLLEAVIEEPRVEGLEGLYIKPVEEVSALTQRRQADLDKKNAALAASSITQTHQPRKSRWQVPALVILFIAAIIVSVPYLKAMFTPEELAEVKPPEKQTTTQTQTLPTTQQEDQISLEHISLSGNQWQVDKQYAHSGADSIRLDQVSSQPSNMMTINDINLSKNANLSLWLMTKPSGKVIMNISLYSGKVLVKEIKHVFNSEAEMVWYMVNPLTDLELGKQKVDSINIVFGGDIDTLWIDDIQVDSYK